MTHLDSVVSFNVPKSVYPVSEAVDVVLHNDVGRSKSYRALSTQWVIMAFKDDVPIWTIVIDITVVTYGHI